MARVDVPDKIKMLLWGKAAGWCQYPGCTARLMVDSTTKAEFNQAYVAHIVADSANGPRGDPVNSPLLKHDINNLMLLCDGHHRLIDKEDVEGHPVAVLQHMKQDQEQRIARQTAVRPELASEIVLYRSNIGPQPSFVNFQKAGNALLKAGRYPAATEADTITLGFINSYAEDHEFGFWHIEQDNLRKQVDQRIKQRARAEGLPHLSVFAIAPIPLLVELGRLLSDIQAVDVYQLHREPEQTWAWQENEREVDFIVKQPQGRSRNVAVILSLSAEITPDRVHTVLGNAVDVWSISVSEPHTSLIRSKTQLGQFRAIWRSLLNQIRAEYPQDTLIHLFPAIPVSIAVEVGRVWQPKADFPIRVYDQSNKHHRFIHALDLAFE